MADVQGTLNGTDVPLTVSTVQGSGYVELCGEMSSSDAFNTELIDITNKCSEENTTYLEGAGLRNVVVTAEALHSEDPGYEILINAMVDRTKFYIRRNIGLWQLDLECMIPTMNLNYGSSEAVTNSITANSTGAFTLVKV